MKNTVLVSMPLLFVCIGSMYGQDTIVTRYKGDTIYCKITKATAKRAFYTNGSRTGSKAIRKMWYCSNPGVEAVIRKRDSAAGEWVRFIHY